MKKNSSHAKARSWHLVSIFKIFEKHPRLFYVFFYTSPPGEVTLEPFEPPIRLCFVLTRYILHNFHFASINTNFSKLATVVNLKSVSLAHWLMQSRLRVVNRRGLMVSERDLGF